MSEINEPELKRHMNYVWGLPEFTAEYHPTTHYPTDWAVISVLQDIRDALIRAEQRETASKRPWWQRPFPWWRKT